MFGHGGQRLCIYRLVPEEPDLTVDTVDGRIVEDQRQFGQLVRLPQVVCIAKSDQPGVRVVLHPEIARSTGAFAGVAHQTNAGVLPGGGLDQGDGGIGRAVVDADRLPARKALRDHAGQRLGDGGFGVEAGDDDGEGGHGSSLCKLGAEGL